MMSLPFQRLRRARLGVRAAAAVLCLVVATACSLISPTAVKAKPVATLAVVQGAGQTAQAGLALPTPIVLRALDATGAAVSGATVTLSVAAGGGVVTPASDTTDALGEFTSKWTLGPGDTAQEILAGTEGLTPVSITATGLVPTQIVLVQGNNQTGKAGAALANSVIVRIVGIGNVPMQGITVGFQVLTGGGGMTPLTLVTDAFGQASTKWTLGAVGSNTALVSSGTLAPVALTATAQ